MKFHECEDALGGLRRRVVTGGELQPWWPITEVRWDGQRGAFREFSGVGVSCEEEPVELLSFGFPTGYADEEGPIEV